MLIFVICHYIRMHDIPCGITGYTDYMYQPSLPPVQSLRVFCIAAMYTVFTPYFT